MEKAYWKCTEVKSRLFKLGKIYKQADNQSENIVRDEVGRASGVNVLSTHIRVTKAEWDAQEGTLPVLVVGEYYFVQEGDFWMIGRAETALNEKRSNHIQRRGTATLIRNDKQDLGKNTSWCYSDVGRTFRKATAEERYWLDACIKADRYLSKEEALFINNKISTMSPKFKVGDKVNIIPGGYQWCEVPQSSDLWNKSCDSGSDSCGVLVEEVRQGDGGFWYKLHFPRIMYSNYFTESSLKLVTTETVSSSLVGRYLKIVVEGVDNIRLPGGSFLKVVKDQNDGWLGTFEDVDKTIWEFTQESLASGKYELMPVGFVPPGIGHISNTEYINSLIAEANRRFIPGKEYASASFGEFFIWPPNPKCYYNTAHEVLYVETSLGTWSVYNKKVNVWATGYAVKPVESIGFNIVAFHPSVKPKSIYVNGIEQQEVLIRRQIKPKRKIITVKV